LYGFIDCVICKWNYGFTFASSANDNVCSKNVWSSGLVLAFVSVTVWRNLSCQIFCETGGERPSIRITETAKRVMEIIIKWTASFNLSFITTNDGMIKMRLCISESEGKRPPTFGKEKKNQGVFMTFIRTLVAFR
jgi:hypothetical protein